MRRIDVFLGSIIGAWVLLCVACGLAVGYTELGWPVSEWIMIAVSIAAALIVVAGVGLARLSWPVKEQNDRKEEEGGEEG